MDRNEKIEETCLAPVGSALACLDTQIIERDGWYQLITPSTGTTQGNEVALSRVSAADAVDVVHRTIAQYAAHRLPFRWTVSPVTEPVLPTHRGRGVYRALLDERLRTITGLGIELAVTHARESSSAPILEALGFESLYQGHMYRWEP